MNLDELDKHLRAILDPLPPGVELSTRELLDEVAKRSDIEPRDRTVYDMIDKLSVKLHAYWNNGQPYRKYGRTMIPKVWHKPKPVTVRCPHCGSDFTP